MEKHEKKKKLKLGGKGKKKKKKKTHQEKAKVLSALTAKSMLSCLYQLLAFPGWSFHEVISSAFRLKNDMCLDKFCFYIYIIPSSFYWL